jgi:hypothetical protein
MMERRFVVGRALRATDGEDLSDGPVIRGYAAVFGERSEDLGGFVEEIAPGAFEAAMAGDVRALFNHDSNVILGRTTAGTLRLWEDEVGLGMEIQVPDTQAGYDLVRLIRRGDVDGASFGFTVSDEGQAWRRLPDGTVVRTLTQVARLFDVGPVVFPAYPATAGGVGMRGAMGLDDVIVPSHLFQEEDGEGDDNGRVEPTGQGSRAVRWRRMELDRLR